MTNICKPGRNDMQSTYFNKKHTDACCMHPYYIFGRSHSMPNCTRQVAGAQKKNDRHSHEMLRQFSRQDIWILSSDRQLSYVQARPSELPDYRPTPALLFPMQRATGKTRRLLSAEPMMHPIPRRNYSLWHPAAHRTYRPVSPRATDRHKLVS